jgi:hypothetical protein
MYVDFKKGKLKKLSLRRGRDEIFDSLRESLCMELETTTFMHSIRI